jgi:hypothetical protein
MIWGVGQLGDTDHPAERASRASQAALGAVVSILAVAAMAASIVPGGATRVDPL